MEWRLSTSPPSPCPGRPSSWARQRRRCHAFKNWKSCCLHALHALKIEKNAAYRCTCLHALENCCLHALKIWKLSTISAPVHQEVKLRKETESAKIRKNSEKPASGSATQAQPEANRRTLFSKTMGSRFSNFLGFRNEYFWTFQKMLLETLEEVLEKS